MSTIWEFSAWFILSRAISVSYTHLIPSFVRKGRIQAIINTVGTKRTADEDGEQIRRSAIEHGVPLFTALDTANAMLKVLESRSFVTEAI